MLTLQHETNIAVWLLYAASSLSKQAYPDSVTGDDHEWHGTIRNILEATNTSSL